jgi:hypothetical protein
MGGRWDVIGRREKYVGREEWGCGFLEDIWTDVACGCSWMSWIPLGRDGTCKGTVFAG